MYSIWLTDFPSRIAFTRLLPILFPSLQHQLSQHRGRSQHTTVVSPCGNVWEVLEHVCKQQNRVRRYPYLTEIVGHSHCSEVGTPLSWHPIHVVCTFIKLWSLYVACSKDSLLALHTSKANLVQVSCEDAS